MTTLVAVLLGIAAGALAISIIYIAYLTIPKLKELIIQRKQRKAKQKVTFGSTRRILEKSAKERIDNAQAITMEELENLDDFCEDNPFFIANYDSDTDDIIDFEVIKTDEVEENVSDIIKDEGIVIFE